MIKLNRKGQNTLEYVLLISSVVAAFLLAQYYLNRGLQGRVRDASDNIGSQFDAGATTTNYTTTRDSVVQETDLAGVTTSRLVDNETTSRTGSETIEAPETGLR